MCLKMFSITMLLSKQSSLEIIANPILPTHLKNMANKSNCPDDMDRLRRQRNLLVKLNKTVKNSFFNKTEPPQSGLNSFWKFCTLLSNNVNSIKERLILVENDAYYN